MYAFFPSKRLAEIGLVFVLSRIFQSVRSNEGKRQDHTYSNYMFIANIFPEIEIVTVGKKIKIHALTHTYYMLN